MANLPETGAWPAGIYQLETTDPVVGGPPDVGTGAGKSNIPLMQLAIRTFLNRQDINKALTTENSPRLLATSGHQQLGEGGLIFQWGRGSIYAADAPAGGTYLTFPKAFPTACFAVIPVDYRAAATQTQAQYVSGGVYTKDGFRAIAVNRSGNDSDTSLTYVALGY
ncbi:gp53-like domain-containing protein [Limimaricola hongkongensis]|uniref:Putative tail fiber protein gp53-like C-terminal domain-containing protein n=1 Tax=Limimaricola hongkongensis DSM 17492 TaxID=1122180 RepID=A0A017HCC9_9RHOB|nr:hypothetical protein [Limimaricola hongkongensis]EYD71813.1 hypothetical protein Lokhon_01883 [Limimaricola hongkongensis DSM 17492]